MPVKREKPATRDVYAVCDVERNACKIGVSSNFTERLRNLHTGSPIDYTVAHIEKVDFPLAARVETDARKILVKEGRSKVREWINDCSPEDARDAIQTAHNNRKGRNSGI